jgi:hypothetical protein
MSLDKLFIVTFLKSVFLGFSNKNTSLKFSKKNLSSYASVATALGAGASRSRAA